MRNQQQKEEKHPILFNREAEDAVIGAILIESSAFSAIASLLKPEMFYNEKYADVFKAAQALYDSGESIDIITLINQLRKSGSQFVDEFNYELSVLISKITSTINIEKYALLIHDEYYRRQLYFMGLNISALSKDRIEDIADILDKLSSEVETITFQAYRQDENITISESVSNIRQEYFTRHVAAKSGSVMGVDTGIDYLNRITSGWQNSNLIILAARPGMGKTSVMLHMAKSAAQSGFNVLIFSLEMSDKELTNKLILSEGNIDSGRYRNGTLNENEIKNMEYCAGLICKLPVIINDKSDISVRRIKNTAKLLKKKGKCDIVFIDYLQLLNMKHENKSYTREQEVSQATRSLKIMAKELDVPVVVLSQLSRNCEDRKDKRPLLSDLRESGAIEQDADIVLFLWRPEYYGLDTYDSRNTKGLMIIDIAKGRSIPTCEIEISYNEQFTKFIDLM